MDSHIQSHTLETQKPWTARPKMWLARVWILLASEDLYLWSAVLKTRALSQRTDWQTCITVKENQNHLESLWGERNITEHNPSSLSFNVCTNFRGTRHSNKCYEICPSCICVFIKVRHQFFRLLHQKAIVLKYYLVLLY